MNCSDSALRPEAWAIDERLEETLCGLSFFEPLRIGEIAEFVRCIEEKREPDCSGKDGARIMRILDAIYSSAQVGASVKIP